VREVLEIVSELAGRPLDVEYAGEADGDVRDTSADTSRARADLGFHAQTSLRDGLRAQFEWQRPSLPVAV
jgi:UDP-glucose 4-epimerase